MEDAASEDDGDKAYVESMVNRLWVLSRSNSGFVRREAFKSLTRFAEANVERLGDVNTLAYVNLLAGIV